MARSIGKRKLMEKYKNGGESSAPNLGGIPVFEETPSVEEDSSIPEINETNEIPGFLKNEPKDQPSLEGIDDFSFLKKKPTEQESYEVGRVTDEDESSPEDEVIEEPIEIEETVPQKRRRGRPSSQEKEDKVETMENKNVISESPKTQNTGSVGSIDNSSKALFNMLSNKLLEEARSQGITISGFSNHELSPVWEYMKSKFI